LCIISWLAWFLVACVVSKKFIKFLRKSLKKFNLNLKTKMVLKRSLEKKKKRKTLPAPLSAQPGLPAHLTSPAPADLSLSLFFLFCCR
jgi:hypothetical protein